MRVSMARALGGLAACLLAAAVLLATIGDGYGASLADNPQIAAQVTWRGADPSVMPLPPL